MNFTTYHNLQKPLDTEKYNIGIHNTNADIIDSVLNRLEQKNNSQDSVINNEIKRAIERENEIDNKLSAFPKASADLDGFMSAEDKRKLDIVTANTEQPNKVWKTDENGYPAWRDGGSSSVEIPVFDDSTNIYTNLTDATDAAEAAGNAIESNKSIFLTLSSIKKGFSAIVQSLKLLTANVGSIHGITSDIRETDENIAASVKAVNQVNSNLCNLITTRTFSTPITIPAQYKCHRFTVNVGLAGYRPLGFVSIACSNYVYTIIGEHQISGNTAYLTIHSSYPNDLDTTAVIVIFYIRA